MDQRNRPQGRKKNVTGAGKDVHKRGEGLGTGRVGSKDHSSGRPSGGSSGGSGSTGGGGIPKRAAAGGGGILAIGLLIFSLIKGGGLGGLLDSMKNSGSSGGGTGTGNYTASSEGTVNTSVAKGSREKRTVIKGNNKDSVTIMVYICGTDLESKYGMATSDIEEMKAASKKFGDDFNIIVYTGGCNKWKTSAISSRVNQIYQIKNGKLIELVDDDGKKAMTDPDNLGNFIKYCKNKFPANRNELILWDHGGGSVSGYGYDEKNSGKGSMDLAKLKQALDKGGMTFDFIGFDACLMATAETALMLDEYADYLIASEETEPGIGWYYTDWLTAFAKNKSMPTVEIGKNIIDDFVEECAKKCKGQKTTLSIIDLAEFSNTVPEDLSDFAKSVSTKITNDEYKEVSDARYNTREFAVDSKIDQVDLVSLAYNMDTAEGKALAESIRSAVKYNRTSTNMTNAYGVSIYFPYKRTSNVDKACNTYASIGMDSDYSKCIRQFAATETSGQVAAGGSSSPAASIFGSGTSSGSSGSTDIIGQLLGSFLGTNKNIDGLDSSNTEFMNEQNTAETAEYLAENAFDPTKLVWDISGGEYKISLTEEQWDLVHAVDKNLFIYDDGGYIDIGLDNVFTYDDDGNLVADAEKDWVAINSQPVAYYHTDTIENSDGTFTHMGYVPAYLNGERVKLIIVFEGDDGYIAGATDDYKNGETETVAKSMTELETGDVLEFIGDYYNSNLEYQDSYLIGDPMTVTADMQVSNVTISGDVKILYCFTDIYNQSYWSEAIG